MLKRSPTPLQASHLHKSAATYPAVYLNTAWRVIVCRDGIQWILQRRGQERPAGARWEGRAYCRTREALVRLCRAYSGPISDPDANATIEALPERFL